MFLTFSKRNNFLLIELELLKYVKDRFKFSYLDILFFVNLIKSLFRFCYDIFFVITFFIHT